MKTEKKMLNTINNAQTIGLSPTESFEIFEKRGLKSEYDEITAGQFDPFYPSEKLQDVFEDNARRGNVPNVFLEAEPTLRAIEAALSNLTLFDNFNLQLEYFLPNTDPLGESALPQTPAVNPGVLQSNLQSSAINQQGLTPTEEALLLPEEKAIRLRQRGLA